MDPKRLWEVGSSVSTCDEHVGADETSVMLAFVGTTSASSSVSFFGSASHGTLSGITGGGACSSSAAFAGDGRGELDAEGGAGATTLAETLLENLQGGAKQLYDPREGIEASIETIAREIYRADRVEYGSKAVKDLQYIKDNGWDKLPVVISKTQYSFSDDASELGAPEGHTLHVRELLPRTGSGFIVVLTGNVMTMPGLPKKPAANNIDVDKQGTISGLF